MSRQHAAGAYLPKILPTRMPCNRTVCTAPGPLDAAPAGKVEALKLPCPPRGPHPRLRRPLRQHGHALRPRARPGLPLPRRHVVSPPRPHDRRLPRRRHRRSLRRLQERLGLPQAGHLRRHPRHRRQTPHPHSNQTTLANDVRAVVQGDQAGAEDGCSRCWRGPGLRGRL